MTEEELLAIASRAEAATAGPRVKTVCECGAMTWTGPAAWVPMAMQADGRWHTPGKCGTHAEALLEEAGALRRWMHDARADLPALLAEVRRLRGVLGAYRDVENAMVRAVESHGEVDACYCEECEALRRLAAALGV